MTLMKQELQIIATLKIPYACLQLLNVYFSFYLSYCKNSIYLIVSILKISFYLS